MEEIKINDIQERIMVQTSLINYLANRMDNLANSLETIIYRGSGNFVMEDQVKATRDWLNAVDMQLTKVCNEMVEFSDAWDQIDENETFIEPQIQFINSKKHEEL
ncbi:hypothetical protein ACVVIH_12995 [Chryseobacterium arthrosphaerae]